MLRRRQNKILLSSDQCELIAQAVGEALDVAWKQYWKTHVHELDMTSDPVSFASANAIAQEAISDVAQILFRRLSKGLNDRAKYPSRDMQNALRDIAQESFKA